MRYLLVLLTAFLIFPVSCSDDSKEHIIPKKELIPLLVDMHLMDAMLANSEVREKLVQRDTINYYETVLEEHGYTKARFDSSINYYSRDLKKFDKIYQEVLARLSQKETRVQEQIKAEREKKEARRDSAEASEEPESEE